VRVAAAALVLRALSGCGGDPACGPEHAVVAHAIDGDTVELSSGEKIRYILADAPESTSHVECFGPEAAAFNRALVEGRQVELRYDRRCADRYGRLLAYLVVDGHEVNRLLVERGYACTLHIPPDGDDRAEEFRALEAEARKAARGLWGSCANALPRCAHNK